MLLLIPLLFFILLELVLYLLDYGVPSQILVPVKSDHRFLSVSPKLGRKYFPKENISPQVSHDRLLVRKPENSYRIFVFGGSTSAGYPYHFNGCFSSMLKILLQKSYPSRYFEIVNFSMTAVNSFTVADLIHKSWIYHPDLILIYTGHNEFYGALGVGSTESIGSSRKIIKFYIFLNDFKTFQLLRDFLNWIGELIKNRLPNENNTQSTLMERMVENKQIRYGGELYLKALRNFTNNMIDIIHDAQKHKVPIVLSTVTSNIHQQPPFSTLILGDSINWKMNYDKALVFSQENESDSAEYYFEKCLAMDSLTAAPHFELGKIRETQRDFNKSYLHYYKAKDYDALRFRASENINDIIVMLSKKYQLSLTDIKSEFEKSSPNSLPGHNLFLEHLHPNLNGYLLMAKTFFHTLIINQLIPGCYQEIRLDDLTWKNFGITALDEEIGNLRVKVLTSGWPFHKGKIGSLKDSTMVLSNIIQELALKYWKNEITWEQAHVQLAEHYEKTKEISLAEDEYQALIKATPYNASPYHRLVKLFLQQKKYEEIFPLLHQLLSYSNDVTTYQLLASAFIEQSELDRAIIYLEEALKLFPNNEHILYLLSTVYVKKGNLLESEKIITYLYNLNPNLPGLKTKN